MLTKRIVRLEEVCRLVGKTPREIYSMVGNGEFPRPRRRGPKVMGWDQGQLNDWLIRRRDAA